MDGLSFSIIAGIFHDESGWNLLLTKEDIILIPKSTRVQTQRSKFGFFCGEKSIFLFSF